MKKPLFITFTGIDDATDPYAARALAQCYPIEFGILFSPERQGRERRYPSMSTVREYVENWRPATQGYAAHLCGAHSRQLLDTGATDLDDSWLLPYFARVQVNTASQTLDTAAIRTWAASVNCWPILQCRGPFPNDQNVSWLFDASGGRGLTPGAWPAAQVEADGQPLVGYAGGIGPSNIASLLPAIADAAGGTNYWIDMESGVRDENDQFDLGKCRAVCEAVFGS